MKKTIETLIALFTCQIILLSCIDTNTLPTKTNSTENADIYRIPIGTCAEFEGPPELFSGLWRDFFTAPSGSESKGCNDATGCHGKIASLGGWNVGNTPTKTETWQNIVNRNGISGSPLITPNDLEKSLIVIRLSAVQNPMPLNGQVWFNTDLQRIKRWICQGALNN